MGEECKDLNLYSQDSLGKERMGELEGALENIKCRWQRNFQNCGKPGQEVWAQTSYLVTRKLL